MAVYITKSTIYQLIVMDELVNSLQDEYLHVLTDFATTSFYSVFVILNDVILNS